VAKIPVAQTLEHAYGFTFGRFLTVIGLTWVSFLILAIGCYFLLPPYFTAIQTMIQTRNPAALGAALGVIPLLVLLTFLCFNMIYVAIARQSLGSRTGTAWFYFSLDAAFWKLLGVYLLMLLVFGAFAIGAVIVVTILSAAGGLLGQAGRAFVRGLAIVIMILGLFYVMLRLMFFAVPVTVAEGRRILRRSWALSGGNFWRIFAVLLAIYIPFVIVEMILEGIVFASVAMNMPPPGAGPEQALAYMNQLGTQLYGLLPLLVPVVLVLYAILLSLLISSPTFAYRALVPASNPEGVAAEFA